MQLSKNSLALAGLGTVAAGLLAAGVALEPAKAAPQQPGGPKYCVLNVRKVFDAYPKAKTLREEFARDIQAKDEELKKGQQEIVAKQQDLPKFTAPADRERVEKEINDAKFQFATKQRRYQQEMAKREAEMYGTLYKDMSEVVNAYCRDQKIHMVFRLDEPTTGQPEDAALLANLSKQVVYHHPNLDLTTVISEYLAGQGAQAQAPKPADAPVQR